MALSLEQASLAQLSQLRWTPMYRRVRAFVDGRVIVDSTDAIEVWEPHRVVGSYAVPAADVAVPLDHPTPVSPVDDHPPILTPEHPFSMHTAAGSSCDVSAGPRVLAGAAFRPDDPDLAGYVLLDWNAFDEWREEEQIVMGHPHDPFKRIDCLPTSRHVAVRIGDTLLAESDRPTLLLETHLPPRHYIPRADVRMEALQRSDTVTVCAYKGQATYWSAVVGDEIVPDVAWTYTDPLTEAEPVRDLICFYDERVEVTVG